MPLAALAEPALHEGHAQAPLAVFGDDLAMAQGLEDFFVAGRGLVVVVTEARSAALP